MRVSDAPSFPNNSALGRGLRVKLSAGFLVVAPADEDELGTLDRTMLATEPMAAIVPLEYFGVREMVASEAITLYGTCYAAAGGKVASTGTLERGIALEAATADGQIIRVLTMRTSVAGSITRENLVQDDLAVYRLGLETWKTTATGQPLGAAAGTPSGAFGITYGTHGTAAPQIVAEAASGASVTNKMRRTFTLPPEYVSGQTITLRVKAKETVGAATVSTTIDAEVYEVAAEAGLGGSPTDLCATAAIDVTTTVGNKDFTITPTNLVAGDELDIELTGVSNDTGATVGTILAIYDVSLLIDIKG